jgi:hypothetical protein
MDHAQRVKCFLHREVSTALHITALIHPTCRCAPSYSRLHSC